MYLILQMLHYTDTLRCVGLYSNLSKVKRDLLKNSYQSDFYIHRVKINKLYTTIEEVARVEWIDEENGNRRPVWTNIDDIIDDHHSITKSNNPCEKYPPGINLREKLAYDLLNKNKIMMDLCKEVLGVNNIEVVQDV